MDKILRSTSISGVRKLDYRIENDARKTPPADKAADQQAARSGRSFDDDLFESALTPPVIDTHLQEIAELHQAIERYQALVHTLEQEKELTRAQLDELKKQAEQSGYLEGYKKGEAQAKVEGESRATAALQSLKQLMLKLEAQSETAWSAVEAITTDLSFAVVCKLLGEHALSRDVTLAMVEKVVASARDTLNLRVLVSPKDFQLLGAQEPEIRLSNGRRVQLVEDVRVELGGCLIETDLGTWDGRLENQLRLLKTAVEQAATSQLGHA